MAPPPNLARRRALTDGALRVLAATGLHGFSHRAVDTAADLPAGTAANYFGSRDALLAAAAERVLELHEEDMAAAHGLVVGPVDREGLIGLLAMSLEMSAKLHRDRYLAVYELTLESTRRPALRATFDAIRDAAIEFTCEQHRALGLATSRQDVETLITLYGGALFTLITGQAGEHGKDGEPDTATCTALARTMVAGISS
ncbi:TetR/AcrR family transcriptional regulator [Catenulispora sp. MAP5-51]|uniref:TetR/AcrR family transcriptional regulator n=1 Tax=Catenulispora sp. MAP5-51 TaxID=3156298 RepID=UPI0035198E41